MAEPATTTEVAPEGKPKLPGFDDGLSSLISSLAQVFTGIAVDGAATNGKVELSQLPAVLKKTATILEEITKSGESGDTMSVDNQVSNDAAPADSKDDSDTTVVFQAEWKLALSKSTGKVLGIFPDNALAERWFFDEAQEEIASKNALSNYNSAVERCKKDVETIIKECQRTNRKFRDPDFNLDSKELCLYAMDGSQSYNATNEPQGNAQARKIFKKPQFYVNGATASDIKQGQAGDCWFLAGIAALTNFKACLTQNYVKVRDDEKVGVYGFVFHRDGEWIYEIVDDFLYTKYPRIGQLQATAEYSREFRMLSDLGEEKYIATFSTGGDALFFAQSRDENETWLPLLEKAFAKAHGDYWAIDGGFTGEAIEDLTGGITSELRTEDILDPDVLWTELELCNEQFIFGCWTPSWDNYSPFSEGLVSGHAYSVMKAKTISIKDKPVRLLLLRNPWGKSEWTGAYSDGSKEMTRSLLETLDHDTGDDGMFYMSYDDFLRKFELLDRIRLIGNDWSCAQCWTNVKIPRTNRELGTRYTFTMDRADYVVMSLSQLDDRYIRGLVGQYEFNMEFRVVKDGAEQPDQVIARSTRGINTSRSVNAEVYLEPGKHNVYLKITAEWIGGKSVKDAVKHYAEDNVTKLIQIAKKYNFAHMKPGVGDKEDTIYESLTIEEEVEDKDDEKKEGEAEAAAGEDDAGISPNENKGQSPDIPVENPVTEEPKVGGKDDKKDDKKDEKKDDKKTKKPKEKKDKSIENWNPIATVGLRLFTRKATVTLSVVQEISGASDAIVAGSTKDAKSDGATQTSTGPTILVSGESAKIGNVPPIGDPLPLTPKPLAVDTTASMAAIVAEALPSPFDINKTSAASPSSETKTAIISTPTGGAIKVSTATSVPVTMDYSGIKEGAEKAEEAKSPEEKKDVAVGDGKAELESKSTEARKSDASTSSSRGDDDGVTPGSSTAGSTGGGNTEGSGAEQSSTTAATVTTADSGVGTKD